MPDAADPSPPRRHILRLPDYDYTLAGAYFVTICTHERACLLGNIEEGQMRISPVGRLVCACWDEIPEHYPGVELDAFVVMPNHLHGIVLIKVRDREVTKGVRQPGAACRATTEQPRGRDGQIDIGDATTGAPGPLRGAPRGAACRATTGQTEALTLGMVIRSFKAAVTREARQRGLVSASRLWQANYYEHIIRGEAALSRIRAYIEQNPAKWALDKDNPDTWR